jgi:hypothetical protein
VIHSNSVLFKMPMSCASFKYEYQSIREELPDGVHSV